MVAQGADELLAACDGACRGLTAELASLGLEVASGVECRTMDALQLLPTTLTADETGRLLHQMEDLVQYVIGASAILSSPDLTSYRN